MTHTFLEIVPASLYQWSNFKTMHLNNLSALKFLCSLYLKEVKGRKQEKRN